MTMTQKNIVWDSGITMDLSDGFIQQYLKHIHLQEDFSSTSLNFLTSLYRSHLKTISYNNSLLVLEGLKKPASRIVHGVELDEIVHRLMVNNRGGYCYETSELLLAVITSLGYCAKRAKAFVINCDASRCGDINLIRKANLSTHNILIVKVDGQDWVLDPGFQPLSPLLPIMLPIEYGEVSISEHSNIQFKIEKLDLDHEYPGEFKISSKYSWSDDWFCIYQFSDQLISKKETINLNHAIYFYEEYIPIRDNFILMASVLGDFEGQATIKIDPRSKKITYTEITQSVKDVNVIDTNSAIDIMINTLKINPDVEMVRKVCF